MARLLLASLLLLLLVGGLLGVRPGGRTAPIGPSTSAAHEILISRVAELAELVTLRVPVSTVITSELAGYTGSASCIIVVNGEVELGVDLEQARIEDVNAEARTATLVLPMPTARAARLDHARTHVYSLDRHGLWVLLPSDEPGRQVVNRGMTEAQAVVQAASSEPRLSIRAQQQAQRVLSNAFKAVGWRVSLAWHADPPP